MADEWEGYEPCSIHIDGTRKITLMLRMLGEDGSVRIAPRKRPYRHGVKLDCTGADGDTYPFEALFLAPEDADEPGVTDLGESKMYPDRLNEVIDAFKTGETGTLNTLRRRGLRVKAGNWSVREVAEDNRNGAILTGSFLEDTEDDMDREAIVRPSPRGTMAKRLDETTFDAEASGAWTPSLKDLTQAVSELTGLMNAPSEYYGQIKAAGKRINRAIQEIRTAFSSNVVSEILDDVNSADGDTKFDDPDSSGMQLKLLEMEDLAARSEWEARQAQRRTTYYYPEYSTDIWSIAAKLKQDPEELSILNQDDFEDLGNIEGGVGVKVYV